MAQRSPEELDRIETKRQENLRKAKGNVQSLALVMVLLALFVVYVAGYGYGMQDARKRGCAPPVSTSLIPHP